jgi:hypothetical protein
MLQSCQINFGCAACTFVEDIPTTKTAATTTTTTTTAAPLKGG